MIQFKPIYIWGQKLEDVPKNDFYSVTMIFDEIEVIPVEDKQVVQDTIHLMGKVNRGAVETTSAFSAFQLLTKLQRQQSVSQTELVVEEILFNTKMDGHYALCSFSTSDEDSHGRPSKIDVLLNLKGINHTNIDEYLDCFHDGFQLFSEKTNRNPNELEKIQTPEFSNLLLGY